MDIYGPKDGEDVTMIEQMSAVALRDELASGALTATALVERCAARIEGARGGGAGVGMV